MLHKQPGASRGGSSACLQKLVYSAASPCADCAFLLERACFTLQRATIQQGLRRQTTGLLHVAPGEKALYRPNDIIRTSLGSGLPLRSSGAHKLHLAKAAGESARIKFSSYKSRPTHKPSQHNKHNTRKNTRKRAPFAVRRSAHTTPISAARLITRSACSGARTTDAAVDVGTMSAGLQLRVSAGELQPGSAMWQVCTRSARKMPRSTPARCRLRCSGNIAGAFAHHPSSFR
jgi:hypothetical protein